MRPKRSPIQPNNSAPISWPTKPAEISKPICGGVSFHSGTSTGRTVAMASASKASKKVATPTMMRVLTCHHEVGSRSIRATTSSTEPADAVELMRRPLVSINADD